jgi:DNA-binding SARP family transcriptional activator
MQIHVIGPVRVHREGEDVVLPATQVCRLLSFLAAWPGEALETDRIMAGLWGEAISNKTRNTLQAHISQLRKLIGGDLLISEAGGYRLNVEPIDVDAHAVFVLVHRAGLLARAGRFAAAHYAYSQILRLFRGQAFAGIEDAELLARRAELDELFAICQEERLACAIDLAIDRHQLGEHIAMARTLVRQRPERERRWELLIRALAAGDRLGEATRMYAEVQAMLAETAGLDPGDALRLVIERALRRDPVLHPALWSRSDNLPHGESSDELRGYVAEAVSVIRGQLESAQRVRICLDVPPDMQWDLAVALGRELRGDFLAGIHLGQLGDVHPPTNGMSAGEQLVIQVAPIPHPNYVADRLSEAFTAPSIVVMRAEDVEFPIPLTTLAIQPTADATPPVKTDIWHWLAH